MIRAYAVENRVFSRRSPRYGNVTMSEAVTIARSLFDLFDLEPIEVKAARGFPHAGSMFYWPHGDRPARIHLGRPLDWMVCHEVAHHAAYPTDRGHGGIWAGFYVAAVEAIIPGQYAARLDAGYRKVGLHPQPPLNLSPPS